VARRRTRGVDSWKLKEWYEILAPEMFGRTKVGETPANDPNKLIGRVVEVTLGEIVNDFTKQNIKMFFKIYSVSGKIAYTKFIGSEITRDYLRSLVRRRTSRIDGNIVVKTKDGYKIRVKPVCFTVKRTNSSRKSAIRKIMEDIIKMRASELDFIQFVQEIVLGKLSSDIYKQVKVIYPPRRVEIRKTEVEEEPATSKTEEVSVTA
jgi:small subunit ribosomal protein S3Ae